MNKKYRILYFRATSMPGAGTRVMMNWLTWLDNNGYGVFVAAPKGGWLSSQLARIKNKKVISSDFFIPNYKSYLKFLFVVVKMCLFVIMNRVDIIHCNSDVAYFTACIVARITRRPVVTHLHFHYQDNFYSWLFGAWRKPDLVIMVSEAFRDEDIDKVHSVNPGIPVKVLHNCIDLDDYPLVGQENGRQSKCVFYPASISRLKNQAQLYRVDQNLREKGCDINFVSAGEIKDLRYWEECQREAEKYPGNKINFVGHVNDVAVYYKKSILSLTLSRYETFGYSVLESMASGVPVVGYRVKAVEEVLGGSGDLVEPDDAESLAEAIRLLRENFGRWRDLSIKGRKRASQYFVPDYICPQLMAMYDDVIRNRSEVAHD